MANFFELENFPGVKFPWFSRMSLSAWIPLKQYVYLRDGGKCRYCEKPTLYEETHCHHVLELSEGGTNHPSNLKTLCKTCHKKRHPFMLSVRDKLKK